MDSYLGAFSKLASAAKSAPRGAEDYFDRLNYVLTPAILLSIATIVGMKQYVFEPIQCWSLKELDSSRMQYAENYCWVENTYHFDPRTPISHHEDPSRGRTIYYYQWVPFILMAQAALFYVPHLLWLLLSCNTGVDIKQIALQSRQVGDETKPEERQKKIRFLATSLQRFIRFRARYRDRNSCSRLASFVLARPAFAMYLVFCYLLVKCCYIANCVGQLHLMRQFLGLNMTTFGLRLLQDIASNRTWETTNVFPRVTHCSFSIRNVGKPRQYTLQCVLPVNMLSEKFYILIWFWVTLLLAINAFSLLRWAVKFLLGPRRRGVVKKFLRIAEAVSGGGFRRNRCRENEFADKFLQTDGAFVLAVISKNAGDVAASDVVVATFEDWHRDCCESDDKLQIPSEKSAVVCSDNQPVMV